jgi:DNA-binding NarL/FixJ family response regulator
MGSAAPLHIAVASDDRLFADGLVRLLSEQPDFVATECGATDPPALARIADAYDVVLLDARSSSGWPRAGSIPDGGVVIYVGAPDDDGWAGAALSAGARGILTRTPTPEEVAGAIRVAHGGGIWARRRWLNACVRRLAGAARRRLATDDVLDTRLSRREREVLRHAATGISNKELADRLAISEATVKVHLTRIFQKLGITSRAALVAAYHDGQSYGQVHLGIDLGS